MLSIGSRVWSPDGSEVVLSSRPNPDIFVIDMVTGDVETLTDDGVIETTPEGLGPGPVDELPVFTPSHNGIASSAKA